MTDKKIRVLVVEDHHVVRRGLVALLNMEQGFQVVGEAATGGDAVAEHHRCDPDVTLIDLSLPGLSGVEVIQRVRRERGKQADLVVVRGDPSSRISDIEDVEIVFKDGVGYDPAKLIESVGGLVGLR